MKEFKQYLHKQKNNVQHFEKQKLSKEDMECDENAQKELLEYISGVIVKINLSKPGSEAKRLKVSWYLPTLCVIYVFRGYKLYCNL